MSSGGCNIFDVVPVVAIIVDLGTSTAPLFGLFGLFVVGGALIVALLQMYKKKELFTKNRSV